MCICMALQPFVTQRRVPWLQSAWQRVLVDLQIRLHEKAPCKTDDPSSVQSWQVAKRAPSAVDYEQIPSLQAFPRLAVDARICSSNSGDSMKQM